MTVTLLGTGDRDATARSSGVQEHDHGRRRAVSSLVRKDIGARPGMTQSDQPVDRNARGVWYLTRRRRIADSNSRSPRRRDNRRDLPQLSAAPAFRLWESGQG